METKALSENISKEDLLIYGVQLLKVRNINYWLDCGTLLGIIRDQKLLPWDKDLDISVQKKNLSKLDIKRLRRSSYNISLVFERLIIRSCLLLSILFSINLMFSTVWCCTRNCET